MKLFSAEVNTSKMSVEELKSLREELQKELSNIDFQIKTREMIRQKHHTK